MKLVIGMHVVNLHGTENVNRIIEAKIQMREHKTEVEMHMYHGDPILNLSGELLLLYNVNFSSLLDQIFRDLGLMSPFNSC